MPAARPENMITLATLAREAEELGLRNKRRMSASVPSHRSSNGN